MPEFYCKWLTFATSKDRYLSWACISVQSEQALYCWLTNFKFSSWYPLKMIMDSLKTGKCFIPFKKFSRLNVIKFLFCLMRPNTVMYMYYQVRLLIWYYIIPIEILRNWEYFGFSQSRGTNKLLQLKYRAIAQISGALYYVWWCTVKL